MVFRPLLHQAYEYEKIAESCDLVFDMAYDMIWNVSTHIAHPNCDYTGLIYGRLRREPVKHILPFFIIFSACRKDSLFSSTIKVFNLLGIKVKNLALSVCIFWVLNFGSPPKLYYNIVVVRKIGKIMFKLKFT